MVDLFDWEDGVGPQTYDDPVRVRLTKYTTRFRAPGEGNNTAGYTGIDPNRGRTYITIRHSNKHYFREGSGYAISTSILEKLRTKRVETIVVYENNKNRSLVFMPKHYYDGDEVPYKYTPPGERQKYAKRHSAIETFEQHAVPITDLRR